MNNIAELQNTENHIDLLCAQRFVYTKAKIAFQTRILLSVLFAILGPILILNFEAIKVYVAVVAVSYAFLDLLFLRRLENNYREDGAKIQELFDTGLFKLDWNNIVVGDRPDTEKIFSYSRKYKEKNDLTNLYNWYSPEIGGLDLNEAVVVCQRTNIWWDVSLRDKLFWFLSMGLLALTLLIFLFFSKDSTVLFSILASLLPLYESLGEYIKSQREAIIKTKALKSRLEDFIERLIEGQKINSSDLRITQDEIYRHRSASLFVPDWFYFIFRSKQEDEMNYSAKYYVGRIKDTLRKK